MKKTLSLILAILMLLPFAVACGNNGGSDDTSAIGSTEPEITVDPDAPGEVFDVAVEGATEYKIIRPEKTSDEVVNAAVKLRHAVMDITGTDVTISEDWYNKNTETLPETAKEILVGQTNRQESIDALSSIRRRDYVILEKNDRIVITGGSDAAVAEAVDYFIANYVDTDGKKVTYQKNLRIFNEHDYPVGSISVAGTPISQFKIVYPQSADSMTENAALNLQDFLLYNAGIEVKAVTDKEAEGEYELLVGNTNRALSATAAGISKAADEFVLLASADSKKIAMVGDGIMVAAAAGTFATVYCAPASQNADVDVKDLPTSAAPAKYEFKEAKNAILMIGDGMGRNQVEATLDFGGLDVFVPDMLPVLGSVVTKSYSVMTGAKSYTDSAASGTAYATGYKTVNGYIGLDYKGKSQQNLRELVHDMGGKTSIITNDKITGATPAVFLAHQKSRNDTDEIQKQIDALIKSGDVNYCKGSLGDGLYASTRESLQLIAEDGSRFFTMIEETHPDKGGHNNEMKTVYSGVTLLSKCAAYATAFVYFHPDTVFIVTADHETGGITKNADGTYKFTTTNHTNSDVPVYAIGYGTGALAKKVDNTDVSKFIAKVYGNDNFGDPNFKG